MTPQAVNPGGDTREKLAICERLRRSVTDTTAFCPSPEYRNPDGPEAAAIIEALVRVALRVVERFDAGLTIDAAAVDGLRTSLSRARNEQVTK